MQDEACQADQQQSQFHRRVYLPSQQVKSVGITGAVSITVINIVIVYSFQLNLLNQDYSWLESDFNVIS